MEALGRMTGGVAHDFNNVLMVMLSGIELIQRKALDRGVERYLVELKKAAERAAHLTRELTSFSRGAPTRTGVTDLNQRVRDVLSMVRQSLTADVSVILSLAEEPLPVDIDAIQFELLRMRKSGQAAERALGLQRAQRFAQLPNQLASGEERRHDPTR